jgi:hypothetical protein
VKGLVYLKNVPDSSIASPLFSESITLETYGLWIESSREQTFVPYENIIAVQIRDVKDISSDYDILGVSDELQ